MSDIYDDQDREWYIARIKQLKFNIDVLISKYEMAYVVEKQINDRIAKEYKLFLKDLKALEGKQ